jgi:hypothetical protein
MNPQYSRFVDEGAPDAPRSATAREYAPRAVETGELRGITYPRLEEFSRRLGRVKTWGSQRLFELAGTLCLGGAVGAVAAGVDVTSTGVLVSTVVGVIALVAAWQVDSATAESASAVKQDIDTLLDGYGENPDIRERIQR